MMQWEFAVDQFVLSLSHPDDVNVCLLHIPSEENKCCVNSLTSSNQLDNSDRYMEEQKKLPESPFHREVDDSRQRWQACALK